jgi:transcriptional regulator with XRE-family HTH domain
MARKKKSKAPPTIRDTIEAMMTEQGVSQHELARRCDMTVQQVNRYLRLRVDVGTKMADKMLAALRPADA